MAGRAPLDCEVLVVGAGPAGSACARTLARAGIDVLLCDRHEFPRDKVCGDGLIPDAHRALARLGLADAVLARAARAAHLDCFPPRGRQLAVPAPLAVLPRRELDELLRQGALAAGARWLSPLRFEAPLLDTDGRVTGARFIERGGAVRELRARWTVLATGADAKALESAGMCERRAPSGMALRGYVRHPAMEARLGGRLQVVWHRALRGGYGWIFPAGGGRFNVGVGFMHRQGGGHHQDDAPRLRELLAAFGRVHEPARELMEGGTPDGDIKGAPLRCSLGGARAVRPGLLATGEAVGSTYLFTGEGIGKAMECGIAAAQAIAQHRRGGDAEVGAAYQGELLALKPRFAAYELANRFNERPWLVDLLFWRAQRSPALLARMAGVLDESQDPGQLASARGLLGLLLPMG